jgi:hypothetical protein
LREQEQASNTIIAFINLKGVSISARHAHLPNGASHFRKQTCALFRVDTSKKKERKHQEEHAFF